MGDRELANNPDKPAKAVPNPRRVEAGRRNRKLRGPLSEEGRRRLQSAIRRTQPWKKSTGPRTAAGKQRSSANGRVQLNRIAAQKIRDDIQDIAFMLETMGQLERLVSNGRGQ